jgi:hypothetical protein
MDSVLDLDTLVRRGPHRFDDISIVFQHHDEGLNWCRFHLNRNVWLMMVGFHQDLRNFIEIANAVKNFGKLITWDKLKSTRAVIVVKVRVEDLRNIPDSIIQSKADDFMGESWAVPIVILQEEILGGGPQINCHWLLRKYLILFQTRNTITPIKI